MAYRMKAVWRILALAWQFTAGWIVTALTMLVAVPAAVLDILWQLVLGSDGFSSSGTVFEFVRRSLSWNHDQIIFGLTGAGGFQALP